MKETIKDWIARLVLLVIFVSMIVYIGKIFVDIIIVTTGIVLVVWSCVRVGERSLWKFKKSS